MTKDALLEIGTEELPASFVTLGIQQLKALAEKSLIENRLAFTSVSSYGTPRRLAVCLHGVADRSQDQEKVIVGPPSAMAKDAQGQWTPAALGFARKQGIKVSDLTIDSDRLCAALHIPGTATRTLLSSLFPEWVGRLEFPKSMTWEPTRFKFPRPIRWFGALYGSDLVSFSRAGVRSGRWTYGLTLSSGKKVALTPAGKYVGLLKNQCVLVEPAARQEAIRRLAEQAVRRIHGHVLMHPALLEQVGNLVEHPVAILGNFDPAYLNLPSEVLITCLEHHQKFFPVTSEAAGAGKLLPHFVGIRNGMSVHQEIVKEGYERVLAARLADARFFFQQDRKTPLAVKVEALKGVIFQEKLGHLFDKKERVRTLINFIGNHFPAMPVWREQALRAAELSKADLVTDMVREFPELQGIVARLYAQADGEEPVVATALEQHYWPITLSGSLPESDVAAAVSLADKLDTLAGDFAVGLIPTGSADPYGLRRAAVGVLRILEDRTWPVPLEVLIRQAIAELPGKVVGSASEAQNKLIAFMKQRWSAVLEERGFKSDEIEAVLAAKTTASVADMLARLQALHEFRKLTEFESMAEVFKRTTKIIHQARQNNYEFIPPVVVQPSLFEDEIEKRLFENVQTISSSLKKQLDGPKDLSPLQYEECLRLVVPLREPLNEFFNKVMVMSDNEAVKKNRLSLLYCAVQPLFTIADFSKLQNA